MDKYSCGCVASLKRTFDGEGNREDGRTVVIGGESQIALDFERLLINNFIRFETRIEPTISDYVHMTSDRLNHFLR